MNPPQKGKKAMGGEFHDNENTEYPTAGEIADEVMKRLTVIPEWITDSAKEAMFINDTIKYEYPLMPGTPSNLRLKWEVNNQGHLTIGISDHQGRIWLIPMNNPERS